MFRALFQFQRCFSQQTVIQREAQKMLAWSIHSYGDIDQLQLGLNLIPKISDPEHVLVEVKAASVNPIDSHMLGGYGRTSFKVMRNFQTEFPLILGRDFSGTIISKGHKVSEKFNVGDEVYGFVPIHSQGSFAEAVLALQSHILPKPKHLSHAESASIVYAAMTAWSGLYLTGNLAHKQPKGLRVLILGGSGGVGIAAIQLLKSQGCVVYTTCSNNAIPFVTALGPDVVFDRNDSDFEKNVELEGKYHVILDAANVGIQNIPHKWNYESYIALNSPLLVNNDKYGLFRGLLTSARDLLKNNVTRIFEGKTVRWAFFVPSNDGFQFINDLICQDKIKPVIQKEFDFKDLPCAIQTIRTGHSRGKLVITHNT